VVLTTFPNTQLDNRYSMNVIEICPVGALTSRDFRFRSRVWEMSSTDSVCTGCSRGCNTQVWARNNEVLRLTPRRNEEVNSYWMCDDGRLKTFKNINSDKRLSAPLLRKDGTLVETGWDEAIAKAASELKLFRKGEIAAIGSPFATNEDNYVFQKFVRETLGVKMIDLVAHEVAGDQDEFLIRSDKTPNSTGAKEVGVRPGQRADGIDAIWHGIKDGTIKALYVLEDDIASDPAVREILSNLELLIVHAHERNGTTELADIVFAASTYAEKHGTFVNFQRHVQRIRPAIATLEQDRTSGEKALEAIPGPVGGLSRRWGRLLGQNTSIRHPKMCSARSPNAFHPLKACHT
jgi:NADH-quinone oxidoreductase subunit G